MGFQSEKQLVRDYYAKLDRAEGQDIAEVMQRYELCEDLANMLQDPISAQQFQLGITEDDALKTCWQGLLVQPDLVQPAEAFWVVCRLAELLSWPIPALAWE